MNLSRMSRLLPVLALALAGWTMPSSAAVNVFFSAGSGCGGSSSASYTPGGAPVQVSLCMTTTAPTATCGHTVVLQSATGESGKFTVVDPFTLGGNYSDPNSVPTPTPLTINNPPTVADFGGTSSASVAAAANQVLATFSLSPAVSATNNSYVISLAPVSIVAVDADGTCGQTTVPTEQAITASFTLNKNPLPVFTSAASTTFAANASNTFNVVAAGATSYSVTGTFPAGMSAASLNTTTGVLSGTPTATGSFPLTITATNGSGMQTQNFTLTVSGQASQTITFANPGTQSFSSTPVALTATASSGLAVSLTTTTPLVCSIVGSNVTMITLGTCTIAANQAGNATYLAAPQITQSFAIAGSVPGAPSIVAASAGDGQASISFTAPSATGGSAITSYTATCTSMSGSASGTGTSSPILVSGLINGTAYQCSVAATNSLGTGSSSASLPVSPAAGVALTLQAVKSRKSHSAAGTFDLAIDTTQTIMGTALTTEPRNIGAGHQIVFQFNNPITAAGVASAVDQASAMVTVSAMPSGNEIVVTIPAIADRSRAAITLTGVNNLMGASGTFTVALGFLVADANNNRIVNSGDIVGTQARSGVALDQTNFRFDFNLNGAINSGDIVGVRARSGNTLN